MRITKQTASDVAKQLVAKKGKENAKIWIELCESIYESVKKTIPKDLIDFSEKYPSYIRATQVVKIVGNGFNHESINITKVLPCKDWSFIYTPTSEEGDKWIKLFNKYHEQRKETETLYRDIENALYNLKTYKAIEENFPEAYKFLPEKITTSLSINLSDIRQKIK
jgi:hypothetical protein